MTKEVKPKKKGSFISILFVLLFLGWLFSGHDDNEKASKKVTTNSVKTTSQEKNRSKANLSSVDYLKEYIKEKLGEKNNRELPYIRKVSNVGDPKFLFAELNADDNLSSKYIRNDILLKSKDIFKTVFKERKDIHEISLIWYFSFQDVKGNSTEKPLVSLTLKRNNANTINWDNVIVDDLPKIVDSYNEHPSLKSE